MNIKTKIQEFIFQQIQKRRSHNPRYQSYRSAKKVLLLFESDIQERNIQMKALVRQMQEDGKVVTAWGYVPEKKVAESAILRDYRVLAQQNFNFWGLPQQDTQNDLCREHFDLLIDLNMNDQLSMRYLNLFADADFRCGKRTDEPHLNDFMVDIKYEDNPAFLFDQIVHYLKAIEVAE